MGAESLNAETRTIETLTLGCSTASFYKMPIFSWLFLQFTGQRLVFLPFVRSGSKPRPLESSRLTLAISFLQLDSLAH